MTITTRYPGIAMTTAIINVVIAVVIASSAAFANKPDSPGNSGKQKSDPQEKTERAVQNQDDSAQGYFNDHRITSIRNYYGKHPGAKDCPPGLAKKNNGCLPPGQAKKWRRGETLPPGVMYSDLPSALLAELGKIPKGQKVVIADDEVLLINVATRMVIDALAL